MLTTPKTLRLHLGIFGRRNVGKSSLLNALTAQELAIVSPTAGTTTDPIEKPFELLPFGPVLFIDTAGVDDVGELGKLRVEKTRAIFARTDVALLVIEPQTWSEYEEELLNTFSAQKTPLIVVINKTDLSAPSTEIISKLSAQKITTVLFSATKKDGILDLKNAIIQLAPETALNQQSAIVADLIPENKLALLVIPIDKSAPAGRLILPQVMTLRNLLDNNRTTVVSTVENLSASLSALKTPPYLVITDSQAFAEVAKILPSDILLTGFSVLFSRLLGDLTTQANGARAIRKLSANAKILIAEVCSHHPIGEDIGRVKIPAMLRKKRGDDLQFTHTQGHNFPADLRKYDLVIMCGGCMFNRREILARLLQCREQNIPVTNYGLVIAEICNILDRALQPFK